MEPSSYPDSSFLVSLFCRDANTNRAAACMAHPSESLLFTPLHRIEVRNAIRNLEARGVITSHDRREAFRKMTASLQDGMLVHAPISWTNALARADDLSEKHAAQNGQRTLDLLHVAIALECNATTFLSFDKRQRSLASAVGLKVLA